MSWSYLDPGLGHRISSFPLHLPATPWGKVRDRVSSPERIPLTSIPGTDKLYITHSEWSSEDAFSASAGAGVGKAKGAADTTFKRLPFNYCSLSLQPFKHPVCTLDGTLFDIENIVPWVGKNGTNPVDGTPLKISDLIKLNFTKNGDGEYVDPVTFKVFTVNTHLVAIKSSGNVFAWDTVEQLNIKAKNWRDLVTDDEFTRKDIITLQDPQNVEARNFGSFKHLRDGTVKPADAPAAESTKESANQKLDKIQKAKEAVAKARAERSDLNRSSTGTSKVVAAVKNGTNGPPRIASPKPAYNAAKHTTGKAAASLTSTGFNPVTATELARLSDEEYMLKVKRVKNVGYARLTTNHGDIDVELYPEYAPKAVWNFIRLAQRGYYDGLVFHRNIKNFMIQGGDPTGTGRGGRSAWGTTFEDEVDGPLTFSERGMLAMANKGKGTNSSQFFITYRAAKHLDRKHSIFGKVVGEESMETLKVLEAVRTDEKDRPVEDIELKGVNVLIDPFEEFMKEREEKEEKEKKEEEIRRAGGTEDDRTTWTGKKISGDGTVVDEGGGVGKYLKARKQDSGQEEVVEAWNGAAAAEPPKKKAKGGFGSFDSW